MHFKLKITCCQTCTDLMSAIVLQCTQSDLYILSRPQHDCWSLLLSLLLLLRWNQTIWTRRTWGSRRGDMVKFHSIVHDDYELHSCRWRGGGSVNRFSYRQSDSHSVLQMTPLSAFDPNQTYVCSGMLLHHSQTMQWQCSSRTDPLALIRLCAVCSTGRHELRFLSCRKKDQQCP